MFGFYFVLINPSHNVNDLISFLFLISFFIIFFQLILVGVCCSGAGDGTDPYAEISLQPLPEYTVPSDGVTMTCITCTDNGRIFLAGRDGHIYELQYTTGSGWYKRCRKVCLTAGVGNVISRYVVLSDDKDSSMPFITPWFFLGDDLNIFKLSRLCFIF